MPDIPEGAKTPSDRKVSKIDQFQEGLASIGLDKAVLPIGLRLRQRNEIMSLALKMAETVGAEEGAEVVELDTDNMSEEQMNSLLGVLADFDEILGANAVDTDKYDAWSRVADYEDFTTLLTLYAGTLGESTSSTS